MNVAVALGSLDAKVLRCEARRARIHECIRTAASSKPQAAELIAQRRDSGHGPHVRLAQMFRGHDASPWPIDQVKLRFQSVNRAQLEARGPSGYKDSNPAFSTNSGSIEGNLFGGFDLPTRDKDIEAALVFWRFDRLYETRTKLVSPVEEALLLLIPARNAGVSALSLVVGAMSKLILRNFDLHGGVS